MSGTNSLKSLQISNKHLTDQENEAIVHLFGEGCRGLCTAKAHVYCNDSQ